MTEASTIGDLYKRKRVTDEQIDATVTDYLNDPVPGPRPLTQGVAIDVCAIMEANPPAREVLALRDSTEVQMRMAVRTAILLAAPIWTTDAPAGRDAPATARHRRVRRAGPEDSADYEK